MGGAERMLFRLVRRRLLIRASAPGRGMGKQDA
jgi:hypothetical protein